MINHFISFSTLLSLSILLDPYYFIHLRVFHTNVNWWFSIGFWVTASLLNFLELFLVFWPISVWMVSTHPLISRFSSPFIIPFVTLPSAPITIGITVTFMFHSFVSSLARPKYYFSFRFLSVSSCGQPERQLLLSFHIKILKNFLEYIHYWFNIFIQIKFRLVIHLIVPKNALLNSSFFNHFFFLKSSNLILKLFFTFLLFLIWLGNLFQKYTGFWNLSRQLILSLRRNIEKMSIIIRNSFYYFKTFRSF